MAERTRVETSFRRIKSKDGRFSPHISDETASRITRYCKYKNISRTSFVEQICNDTLDKLERELYENMTKEELIDLIMMKRV